MPTSHMQQPHQHNRPSRKALPDMLRCWRYQVFASKNELLPFVREGRSLCTRRVQDSPRQTAELNVSAASTLLGSEIIQDWHNSFRRNAQYRSTQLSSEQANQFKHSGFCACGYGGLGNQLRMLLEAAHQTTIQYYPPREDQCSAKQSKSSLPTSNVQVP